jgi:putative CocE/NonD family hydrolase
VVVDSRGAGQSPGKLWVWSPQEVDDYADCIEWAGVQGWSNGKVGLLGISYYAMNQWQVAARRPVHLAAICPWEGTSDMYRDASHHGGIFSNFFFELWFPKQILSVQNGNADSPFIDRDTGTTSTGEPLDADALRANRVDVIDEFGRIRWPTIGMPQGLRSSPTSRCRSCPRETGAAWGCIFAATCRAF